MEDVFNLEPSYYSWMMRGDFPLYTKRKLEKYMPHERQKTGRAAAKAAQVNLLNKLQARADTAPQQAPAQTNKRPDNQRPAY